MEFNSRKNGKNYISRLKKVIEIEGERLEPYHLRQIEKEAQDMENEEDEKSGEDKGKKGEKDKEKLGNNKLRMKIAYNDQKLKLLRKKEIAQLKKKIDSIKKNTQTTIKKINQKSIHIPGIVLYRKKRKEQLREKKRLDKDEIKVNITKLEKMCIENYLEYLKEKEAKIKKKKILLNNEQEEDESTIDESIQKILELKKIINKKVGISFEIEF